MTIENNTVVSAGDANAAKPDFEIKHHHAAISVPALQPSIDWYRDKLGFYLESTFELPEEGVKFAIMRRDDLRVEIMQAEGSTGMSSDRSNPRQDLNTHGNKHFCFAVRSIQPVKDALKQRNVDIAQLMETAVYVRDNCGNLLEFVEQADLWD